MEIKEENLYKLAEEIKEYKDAGSEFCMYSGSNNYMYRGRYCGFLEIKKDDEKIIVYALSIQPRMEIKNIKEVSGSTLKLLKSTEIVHYAKSRNTTKLKESSDFYYDCIIRFLEHTISIIKSKKSA